MAPSADEMNIVNGAIGQNRHLQADQCGGDFGATVFEKSELRRVPNSIKFGIVRELFSRPLIWRNLPIIAQ
jgi:hypothetical protein